MKWISLILILCVGVVVYTAASLMNESVKQRDRLFQQCIDDGLKEYECVALIHRGYRR